MSDKTLRLLVAIIIGLLLVYQVGSIISDIFGWGWGIITAAIVAGVSFFSVRLAKANGASTFWFMLPTMLFTIIPISWMLWKGFTGESSGFERFLNLSGFFIGFAIPMALLFIIYFELRKRSIHHRLKH